MPVCDAGSERQSGTPATVRIDPLFMASLMPPEVSWVLPYLPFMQPFTLDLDAFCALDPPADPGITDVDLIGLMPPSPYSVVELAAFKMAQLVHIYAWYRFCRCSDATTPDPPSTPTVPSPLPIPNPPGQTSPGGQSPCRTDIYTVSATYPASQAFSPTGLITGSTPTYPVPSGATSVRITCVINNPTNQNVRANVFFDAVGDGTPTSNPSSFSRAAFLGDYFNFQDSFSNTNVWTVSVTQPYFWLHITDSGTTSPAGNYSATWTLEWICPSDASPCVSCPPDPYLLARLDTLMAAVLETRAQANLIQRQGVPFGYVPGDLHTGLSGADELAVADLVGAKISITATTPGTIGSEAGNPLRLFGTGYVQWGSTDGYTSRIWLDQVDTLTFPPVAGVYTLLAYSLPPGVVVDILELQREP